MSKVNLTLGNVSVICNSYDEAARIAKPFVEKMISININPVEIKKPTSKPKEAK